MEKMRHKGRSFKVDKDFKFPFIRNNLMSLPKNSMEIISKHPLLYLEKTKEYIEVFNYDPRKTSTEKHEEECCKILGDKIGVKFYRWHWKVALVKLLTKMGYCSCEEIEKESGVDEDVGFPGKKRSVCRDKSKHYVYCSIAGILKTCSFVPDGWGIGLKPDGGYHFIMLEVEDSLKLNYHRLRNYADFWFMMDSVSAELQDLPHLVVVDSKNQFSEVSLCGLFYATLPDKKKKINTVPPDCAVPLGQSFPELLEVTDEGLRGITECLVNKVTDN